MRNRTRRAVFYSAVLLLVTLFQPFAARAADCEAVLLADVRVYIAPDGQLFLPATIGGRQVYFELSMGSGLPMLLESSVKALGLIPKRMNGTGEFYSRDITHFVQLEGLKVGDFQFKNRAAPVLPEPDAAGPHMLEDRLVAGTIGSTLFRGVDAELNLAERQLKLFSPFRCVGRSPVSWGAEAAKLPMRFDQAGALMFTLQLNGRKVEASMLSGSRYSTIDVNAAREFFGFDENSAGVKIVEAADGSPRRVFHAMSLTGPGLEIPETSVQLRGGSECKLTGSTRIYGAIGYTECLNVVPFRLGVDLLSRMRIYVASERQTVFVKFLGDQAPAN